MPVCKQSIEANWVSTDIVGGRPVLVFAGGAGVTWLTVEGETDALAVITELARNATELGLEVAQKREAVVESVADSLRAHLSDAVAGDDTVPHEDTSATGHLVAAEAGGCVMATRDDDRPQQNEDAMRDEARREGWAEGYGRPTRGVEEQ